MTRYNLSMWAFLIIAAALVQVNSGAAVKARSKRLPPICKFMGCDDGHHVAKRGGQCAAKFRSIPNHSACLNVRIKSTDFVSAQDKVRIVKAHNDLRMCVSPPATDMKKMYWDNEIASIAQKWASNCIWSHDENQQRRIPGRFGVGQNLAYANGKPKDWKRTIFSWYNEVDNFQYRHGSINGRVIGHYTQVVWATSNKIGCGFAKCHFGDYYVCNYGPAGNYRGNYRPYRTNNPYAKNTNPSCKSVYKQIADDKKKNAGCTLKDGTFIGEGQTNKRKTRLQGRMWNEVCQCHGKGAFSCNYEWIP